MDITQDQPFLNIHNPFTNEKKPHVREYKGLLC